MARPQFSQMLVDRRRDLGLTIEQASRVLKMKQQVITAFEEGDWDRIPRSGYAQGMLSSYARYLGLNPRHVIDQFKQDLYAYSHDPSNRESVPNPASSAHRKLAGYADRYAGQGRRSSIADDIDLYGSAGPAGSIMSSGTFDEEMYRRLARERGGHRGVGYSERYLERSDDDRPRTKRGDERPYTGRVPNRGAAPRQRPNQQRSSIAASKARSASRQTIQTRAVDAHYEDDLRYDRARPYEAASTEQGRADSRHIARTERPNVPRVRPDMRDRSRRRGDAGDARRGDRGRDRGRDRDGRRRGQAPQTPSYLAFDARTLAFVVIGLFIAIMLAIVFTIGSCVSNVTSTEKPQVPVGTAPADVGADEAAGDADGTGGTTGDTDGTGGAARQDSAAQTLNGTLTGTISQAPNSVTVSVQDGMVSWVEVVMGDMSLVAQTVSGPWEQTFRVTAPMEIRASDAAAVQVTADGKPVSFDSKTSGVGVITIAGPEDDATGDADDARTGDGGQDQSGDGADEAYGDYDGGDATGDSPGGSY